MNLMFSCPAGFTIHASSLRRNAWLWAWANRLIMGHVEKCAYCKGEKDAATGREVGK